MNNKHPHLIFTKHWHLTELSSNLLGQCEAYIEAINFTPIMPIHYRKLLRVALVKGAQATTAIEGNTLTDDEVERLVDEEKLPPSKEYQEIEVKNILNAYRKLFKEVVYENTIKYVSPSLLLRFHKMVGKDLHDHFDAIPGKFRETEVYVGKYQAPDHIYINDLVKKYCEFLRNEFKYREGKQTFEDKVIQAIVSHVYLEWIHPFSDGNGRTGRLLEFYLLLRGGNPDIASHIMSNHYNLTRNEYYRQLQNASNKRDLTEFIEYALLGFRDGLKDTLSIIQISQFEQAWKGFIYDTFNKIKIVNKEVFKRRRTLGLELPLFQWLSTDEIPDHNVVLAKLYSKVSKRTLLRDLEELLSFDIIIKHNGKYSPKTSNITRMIAKRKV